MIVESVYVVKGISITDFKSIGLVVFGRYRDKRIITYNKPLSNGFNYMQNVFFSNAINMEIIMPNIRMGELVILFYIRDNLIRILIFIIYNQNKPSNN